MWGQKEAWSLTTQCISPSALWRAPAEEDTRTRYPIMFKTMDSSSNTGVPCFPSDREPQLQAVGPLSKHRKESKEATEGKKSREVSGHSVLVASKTRHQSGSTPTTRCM